MAQHLKRAGVISSLFIATLSGSAFAVTPDDEKSPTVPDVLGSISAMHGHASEIKNTHWDNWASSYGDGVAQGDHVQGITMTASGHIVIAYSRTVDAAERDNNTANCDGMLIFSKTPFDPDNPDNDLDWGYYCDPQTSGGPEKHPSTLQASGNILAVGTHQGSRLYRFDGSRIFPLPQDSWYENATYAVNTDGTDANDIWIGGRDVSSLAYNPVDKRFYLINADGTTDVGTTNINLCRSAPDISLVTPPAQVFTEAECVKIENVYASANGANLIIQDDGKMFLASTFSTGDEPDVSWAGYGTKCGFQAALLPDKNTVVDFEDVLYVSELNYDQKTAKVQLTKNLRRTQTSQICVHYRPAFRFAGAIASTSNDGLVGLWSGRQNPPIMTLGDSYEFAFQKLDGGNTNSSNDITHFARVDCHTDDLSNEGTNDVITATFYGPNMNELGKATQTDISERNCKFRWINFEADLPSSAEYVKLSTDGTDGFMVDRIQLFREGMQGMKEFGLNNDKGWCLSNDAGDGEGNWKYASNGICVPYHTWSYSGKEVRGDIALARMNGRAMKKHSVGIDCQVDDIGNEGTTGTITATFYNKQGTEIGKGSVSEIADGITGCARVRDIEIEADTRGDAETVKISTNSGDGFMIDRIHLYRDGELVRTSGANNDKGWCLSTQESDGEGSWSYAANGICVPYHTWSYSGATVSGHPYDVKLANQGGGTINTYAVDVDCDVSGGVSNEHTGGTLTVIFQDRGGRVLGRSALGGGEDGPFGCTDLEASVQVRGEAGIVRFETNSSDAAMLDEITVLKNGDEIKVFGDSDDKGWCLSTQASDANGNWKGHIADGVCRPAVQWSF